MVDKPLKHGVAPDSTSARTRDRLDRSPNKVNGCDDLDNAERQKFKV